VKIGMMSRWNTSCGVSTHAELIGKTWVKMGYSLKILAPKEWTKPLTAQDESYVIRCYRLDSPQKRGNEWFFDKKPFLDDFDIFVVQNLELMPRKDLILLFPQIREKAKTVLVIHEGKAPENPDFYKFDFDSVVCFDGRYRDRFLRDIFPEEKIHIIPYPCHPLEKGNKEQVRKILGLPLDKRIVFNYGLGVFRHLHLLPEMERLSQRYPLLLLTLTEVQDWYDLFEVAKKRYKFIELRKGPVCLESLYSYLHASDALLLHKDSTEATTVSSTIYTCLGSGCPILTYNTNFVEDLGEEIIKYKKISKPLREIFEGNARIKTTLRKAEELVKRNSSYEIGKRFIELFKKLLLS